MGATTVKHLRLFPRRVCTAYTCITLPKKGPRRMRIHTVRQLALSAMLITVLFTGGVLHPRAATAATYYVATTGNDANPGTQAQPFQTIGKGLRVLTAGDTLYLRDGTYTEEIDSNKQRIPTGTSWSNAVTIAAYPGEPVTLQPSAAVVVNLVASYVQYVILDGLVLDAGNSSDGGISILNGAHHIRVQNGEVKNAPRQGIFVASSPASSYNEFLNLKVHDNGGSGQEHGFYIQTTHNLIDGCKIYNNAGYGVHIYNGYPGERTDANTVRNNQIHDNRGDGGVVLGFGDGNLFYNNLVYNHAIGLVTGYQAINTNIDSNTFENNVWGIAISADSTGAIVQNNIVYHEDFPIETAIDDRGVGTILWNNIIK